ncbi:DEAD Asp Glu Ala Asp box polypeptide 21 [Paragonimus heterotremus]|uniref:DEAD Asp Glu Ala Asp box polypeptide 21 n=1 Tax=Paragonimus heterotremus TaxID=100268 RepID=A0A8J4TDV1_9TREM|nr:DEAD Asp Glu Ala Asp box polypeptide 21 [Paragonimus heterotremus]
MLSEGDFSHYEISEKLIKRLRTRGIEELFPVQYKTYKLICDGSDVIVIARTGTGKTLAFSLPITQLLLKQENFKRRKYPVVLVLAPTRELVVQISGDFQSVCAEDFTVLAVYGGVPIGPQCSSLRRGVDVLVGTPGRIIDLMERGVLVLDSVKHVVLDEVDRMLDMGFSKDVESIISHLYEKKPDGEHCEQEKPQTLLFSATMPPWVSKVASKYLSKDVHRVSLIEQQENKTALNVTHLALPCPFQERASTMSDVIRTYCKHKKSRCIIFCETKKDADELAAHSAMSSDCHVFHGDIPQDKRELILQKFREGKYRVLITTNVAARGLDVPEVDLVIQCHPPRDVEDYIHRSGRTGRAERCGTSVVFYVPRERPMLTAIERKAGVSFRRISAPTLQDIIDSWGTEVITSFQTIPEQTWSAFIPIANRLIETLKNNSKINNSDVKKGKTKKKHKQSDQEASTESNGLSSNESNAVLQALCCALARISGKHEGVESRSLLNALKGYTTYKLDMGMEVHRKGQAYAALREQLPENILENVKNLSFVQGRTSFVFDLPSHLVDTISSTWDNANSAATLSVLTELPELEPEEDRFAHEAFNGYSRGNWRNGPSPRWSSRGGGRGSSGFRPSHNSLSFQSNWGFKGKRGSFDSSEFGVSKRIRLDGETEA